MTYKNILNACIDLSYNQIEGSLFVIESKKVSGYYKSGCTIYKESGQLLSVMDESDKQVIRKLASLDGAMIIDSQGRMKSYGATLVNSNSFTGHGKRHEFAKGTSIACPEVTCVLTSEEDRRIRIFRHGELVVDINSRSRMPRTAKDKVAELLTSRTSQTLIASGVAASVLTLNPLPAIITITGSHLLVNEGVDRIKNVFRK
jgi:hypothetical protein